MIHLSYSEQKPWAPFPGCPVGFKGLFTCEVSPALDLTLLFQAIYSLRKSTWAPIRIVGLKSFVNVTSI